MRVAAIAVCILLVQSTALAGTNDIWQVMCRACDSGGNFARINSEFGTGVAASDGLDSMDTYAPYAISECAMITCYDLGIGVHHTGYSADYRAPVTDTAKTWNLRLCVGASYGSQSVCLRLWNPSGVVDINGTIPISLKVAADPTGTHSPGAVLIPAWDPDKNGTQIAPAYEFTFNNAAALLGGAAVEFQLVAGNASEITCSIGEARDIYAGQAVVLNDVTTSSGGVDLSGLWVSTEGLPGLRVSPGLGIAREEVVDLAGVVTWTDGVPTLTNAQLRGQHGTAGPPERVMPGKTVANDRRETLSYSGMNLVGTLCVTCGEVVALDTASEAFYVDDGSGLADGLGPTEDPYKGLRVVCGTGISLPDLHTHVRVAGMRSVEKHVLSRDAVVNGEQRQAGETLYVPVVLIRDSRDIFSIDP